MIGLKNKNDRKIFQQVILCDNFLSFKKIMIAKNKRQKPVRKSDIKNISKTKNDEAKKVICLLYEAAQNTN